MRYLLYLPENYFNLQTRWPLILFLHGAGELGTDYRKILAQGLPKKLNEEGPALPFIIVSPQIEDYGWTPDLLKNLLTDIVERYSVDKLRIYVTGLSMGGFGTWDLAMDYPDLFAALAPICGGGEQSKVSKIKHIPCWIFHNRGDDIVPVQCSLDMVRAYKDLKSEVEFTQYESDSHDAWTAAYSTPLLYDWFLKHTLPSS